MRRGSDEGQAEKQAQTDKLLAPKIFWHTHTATALLLACPSPQAAPFTPRATANCPTAVKWMKRCLARCVRAQPVLPPHFLTPNRCVSQRPKAANGIRKSVAGAPLPDSRTSVLKLTGQKSLGSLPPPGPHLTPGELARIKANSILKSAEDKRRDAEAAEEEKRTWMQKSHERKVRAGGDCRCLGP